MAVMGGTPVVVAAVLVGLAEVVDDIAVTAVVVVDVAACVEAVTGGVVGITKEELLKFLISRFSRSLRSGVKQKHYHSEMFYRELLKLWCTSKAMNTVGLNKMQK